jgi:drug/metabolite transporter (DMT)-like permease
VSQFWAEVSLFYCALAWGATFYLVKDALAGVDALVLVAYRFFLSAILLLPWVLTRAERARGRYLKESAILAVLLSALYITQTIGLGLTSAANSGFITGLFVLFVPLFLLFFFRQPPTFMQWVSVAIAVLGLWFLTGGLRSANAGDAVTIVSAAAYAAHLLATDRAVREDADVVVMAFHQFWMTGLIASFFAGALGRSFTALTPRSAATIAFLSVIPTATAFYLQMRAQKTVAPLKVSLIFTLEPVFAAVFAWTLGGEPFSKRAAVGGGLIVAAMILGEISKLDAVKGQRKEILST